MVSVTFVVVSDASAVTDFVDRARGWIEAGLADDFLVVAAPDTIGADEPVGRWVSTDDVVRAQSVLASRPYSTIRVVAHQWLRRGASGDHAVPEAARALALAFRPRLAGSQQLVEVNLLVPDDRVRHLPPDLLAMHGSANVVLAPEDRESPHHASHPLDDDDRLHSHGIVGLFGVAGLWAYQSAGPFDTLREAAFNEMPHVFLARCFGRIARAPMLVEHVTKAVLEQRATAPWAAEAVGGVAAPDPYGIASAQADSFLARHGRAFSFDSPAGPQVPRLESVGAGRAFAMMFSYIGRGLRSLPVELASHASDVARRAVADFAQGVTFGPDSRVLVRGASQGPAADVDLTTGSADMATALLKRAGGAAPVPPAAGDAWQDLRTVALALVDGSQFPSGFDRPTDGVVLQVVTDPHAIAPDPLEGPFVPDASVAGQLPASARARVRPSDAAQAAHLKHHLEAPVELDPDDDESALGPPGAAGEELDRLEEWTDRRRRSLTWLIGDHLSANLASAHDTFSRALRRVREGATSADGLLAQKARRRLHRRWWIWLAVVLLCAGLAWYGATSDGIRLTTTDYVVGGVVALVAIIVGWLVAFISFMRTLFQLQHRLERDNAEYKAAVHAAISAAESIVQLSSLNRQFRDWAEIVGWMVHHPETSLATPEDVAVPGMDLAVPASHQLAVADRDERAMTRLAAVVGRDMFGSGWLVGLFGAYRDAAMESLRYELGHSDATAPPDPDHDPQPTGPRDYLLRSIESREPSREWTESRRRRVAERLQSVPSGDLFDTVTDSEGRHLEARHFLFGALGASEGAGSGMSTILWRNAARMARREQITRTYGWSTTPIPQELAQGIEELDTRAGRVGEAPIHDVAVVRLDMTAAVPFTDLELFMEPQVVDVPTVDRDQDEVW